MPPYQVEFDDADARQRPAPRRLRVATCQFDVDARIEHNRDEIVRQMREAAAAGARAAHFPETALSGYAGYDIADTESIDWTRLRAATEAIAAEAARLRLWVLLGSAHRLSEGNRPHNSVYVISDQGRIVDRYDKRFCTGVVSPERQLDLRHYTPGNHATVFDIEGVRCGVLICYDYRFPELFRELKQAGVELLFHSYHNARHDESTFRDHNLWKEVVPAVMMAAAASNHFWISAANSSARWSLWPAFAVRPDGQIAGQLPAHAPGVLVTEVLPDAPIWDAAGPWRDRAMQGRLHSGELVDDPRSHDRTAL